MKTISRLLAHPVALVTLPFRWLGKTVALLREARQLNQRFLAGRDLIASELRHNAQIVGSMGSVVEWRGMRGQIRLDRWQQYGGELSIFRKRHPDLWRDLVATYEKLQRAATGVAPGIFADDLEAVATRLQEAEL